MYILLLIIVYTIYYILYTNNKNVSSQKFQRSKKDWPTLTLKGTILSTSCEDIIVTTKFFLCFHVKQEDHFDLLHMYHMYIYNNDE